MSDASDWNAANLQRVADALEAIAATLATIAQHLAPVTAVNAKASNWTEETVGSTPATDGWIEWHGGECPVPEKTLVEVRWSDDDQDTVRRPATANWWRWSCESHLPNIVAYRLAPAK